MAAPEYFIKLKFGTELEKKQFSEIQDAYNKLAQKQKTAFARMHNSSIKEMDALFKKQTNQSLRDYERAAQKTEQAITRDRISNVNKVAQKQKDTLKMLGKVAGGALGIGAAVNLVNTGINTSFGLTSFQKNTATGMIGGLQSGAMTGAAMGGIPGALIGGVVGTTIGYVMSEMENSSEKISRSATLFNDAVNTYKKTLSDATNILDTDMLAAGFTDAGEYATYRGALAAAGFKDDSALKRSFQAIGNKNADLGAMLLNSRTDYSIAHIEKMYKESGLNLKDFLYGQLGLSAKQAEPLLRILSEGWTTDTGLLQTQLAYAKQAGLMTAGGEAGEMNAPLKRAHDIGKDLELRTYWQQWQQAAEVAKRGINLNNEIIQENAQAFERSVSLMKQSNLLLAGINKTYESYQKELKEIFSEITRRTGTRPAGEKSPSQTYAEATAGMTNREKLKYNAEHGINLWDAQKMQAYEARVKAEQLKKDKERAEDTTHKTRLENTKIPLRTFG